MRKPAIIAGVALLLLTLAPVLAAAQAWSVQVDGVTEVSIRTNTNGGASTQKGEDVQGGMVAIGTPYHVGFGFDSYNATFFGNNDGGGNGGGGGPSNIKMSVTMANVFVDIPVPIVTFSLGTGWGQGKLDPDSFTSQRTEPLPEGLTTNTNKLGKLNLWQFYAQLGVPIAWGFEVHVAYREFRGVLKSTENRVSQVDTRYETKNLYFVGQTTSLGLRYTF